MEKIESISFMLKRRSKVDSITGLNVMSDKHLLIVMRVSMKDFKVDFSTGLHVNLDDWDASTQRVKPCCDMAEQINDGLGMTKLIFKSCVRLFYREGVNPNKRELTDEFRRMTREFGRVLSTDKAVVDNEGERLKDRSDRFWNSFDQFRSENNVFREWGKAIREKFHSLKTHMEAFEQMNRESNKKFALTFEFFTKEGLDEYCQYVQDHFNLRNVTMMKHLDFLRWFLRWALSVDKNRNIVFESYRPHLRCNQRRVISLDVDELQRIANLQFASDNQEENVALEHARDVFLFMCLTGLRYSDVYNLNHCDLVTPNGMAITTIKTNDNLDINLNKFAWAILKKYEKSDLTAGKALPVTSNQKLNEHIHKICRMAGITQPTRMVYYKGAKRYDEIKPKYDWISSKIGRKTFVCIALSLGIDRDTVMKWTGHKDYKSMDPYVDIADSHKQKAMKLFDLLNLWQIDKDDDPEKK